MTRWSLLQILCFSLCCIPLIEKSKQLPLSVAKQQRLRCVSDIRGVGVASRFRFALEILYFLLFRLTNAEERFDGSVNLSFFFFASSANAQNIVSFVRIPCHALCHSSHSPVPVIEPQREYVVHCDAMRCDAKMNSQRTIIIEQCARHHHQCNSLSFSVRRIKRSPHRLCCGCEIWISRIRDYTQKKCLTINSEWEWSMPSSDVLVRSRNIYDLPW